MPKSFAATLPRQELAGRLMWQLLARQGRRTAADLRNIPRYALHGLIGVIVVCGLVCFWGLHSDGKMPGMSSLFGLDPYRMSSARCIAEETGTEARWNGLSPALAILDRVNPVVAKWVREKHDAGLIAFGDHERKADGSEDALAEYDVLRDRVVVNRHLFSENDGTIAVTLCHEYRHSRQNLGKFCQYVLSFLLVRGGNLSIIENDAVLYEREAHDAIFGNGTSSARQLAAWEAAVRLRIGDGTHRRVPPKTVSIVASRNLLP